MFDAAALNLWVNARSRVNQVFMILCGIGFAMFYMVRQQEGESVVIDGLLLALGVGCGMGIYLLYVFIAMPVVLLLNIALRTYGEKTIAIDEAGVTEDDGRKVERSNWGRVRSIELVQSRLFIRRSFWRYHVVPASAFGDPAEFADYYAQAVRVWSAVKKRQ
ncbi:MAG: hypothetical protein AAFX85_16080 [Pseudomonadota bacterium]